MAAKLKFNPRFLMEQAVEIMRESVHEPRDDGRATPSVGAVIYLADGTVDTACRGELRFGDHAEFTLLERKHRADLLAGARLFTTLEPCAEGARQHPKLSCAERVHLARISEVWIGIEDPDPKVDRRGIKYLQDHGVKVQMFDRDLQEIIRAENRSFIDQALERASAAQEEKPRFASLSSLESALPVAVANDFSSEALDGYRAEARIPDTVGSPEFNRRLEMQGLLHEQDGKLTPTGFGILLFGKEPRFAMPQAGLLGTIHHDDGREEIRDFDGPAVFVPEQALRWLKDKLPNPIDRSQGRREEASKALFEMAREGIVNALVHRDYGIQGAKCQLVAGPESIVIMSPGRPIEPITLRQLQSLEAPMLSRNPALHFVFSRMGWAEEAGLGLKSMKTSAQRAGLPMPKYGWEDPYLVLTLYRGAKGVVQATDRATLAALSTAERSGWEWLATKEAVTSGEYANALGVAARTALSHLSKMNGLGLVERVGSGRATRYIILRP